MKRFFTFLLGLLVVGGGTVAFAYRFPERVPPVARPYLGKLAETIGLAPVPEATAQPRQQRQVASPQQGPRTGGPLTVAVEAQPVKIDSVKVIINAVGTLLANESIVIAPEAAGRVSEIHFQEGKAVKAGDPLVSLEDSILRAELANAQSALKLAQANFERADTLARQQTGTARARDEALAALESARASVELAQARLDRATIRAPFAGILGLRSASIGEYVSAGDTLGSLQSIDPIKVDFRIPETFLAHVATGQRITITVDALPGESFEGEIYAIDPQVDVNGRALKLRAAIPNGNGRLRPGLFARVEIIAERRDGSILVPESALVPLGEQRFVYVVRGGKAARVPVTLGQRLVGEVEIVEGLTPSDLVVTAGQQKLSDGTPVEIVGTGAGA